MAETSGLIATWLDWLMLLQRGVAIADPFVPLEEIPAKTGAEVFGELGGRFLLRYLTAQQVHRFERGDAGQHFVTPTAYTSSEAISYLALPAADVARGYLLILDPRQIDIMHGPQWTASSGGIQYV